MTSDYKELNTNYEKNNIFNWLLLRLLDWRIFWGRIWLDLKVFKNKETIEWWKKFWALGHDEVDLKSLKNQSLYY